ncbi:MAG: TauD/TfdA family dioxygenase [Myxococcota bacterium]
MVMQTSERAPARAGNELAYRTQGDLPLTVAADGRSSVNDLVSWLVDHEAEVREGLTRHGAVLFRGFDVSEPTDFERIARAIDDDLKNEYLGLSPRNAMTDYVFTASEIPSPFPIPEHNEMSFVANPPRSVFFWCKTPPAQGTGETPLVDMRAVYADLDPVVRDRFERKGIRVIRNYRSPGRKRPWDLSQLKPWQDMFQTTDRSVVEAKCAEEGFEAIWEEDGTLKLLSEQPAVKPHPRTGEPVWFNHAAVLHSSNGEGELRRVFALRPSARSLVAWAGGTLYSRGQRRFRDPNQLPMHCTYGDGTEIPFADMEAVRDAIWKNLVITPWRAGDVLAIDNDSTGHGRMPFYGRRMIAVAWA